MALDLSRVRVVVFDVDGTLYRQGPVRRAMALRLLRAHLVRPVAGARTFRVLASYRSAQERMRADGFRGDVAGAQIALAAERSGATTSVVERDVRAWLETSPLDVVARHARSGLVDVLDALQGRGCRLSVVSDYPADAKLSALGIADRFEAVISAQDTDVGAFKPQPRGIEVALERLNEVPEHALFVGDRPEVDAAAANAAGVPCVIVGGSNRASGESFLHVKSFSHLCSLMESM